MNTQKKVFGTTGDFQRVRFCPDGEQLVAVSKSGLSFWNTRTWEKTSEISGQFRDLVFDPAGQSMAVIDTQGWRVLRVSDWKEIQSVAGKRVELISFGPNGKRLITTSADQLTIWDLNSGEELHVLSVGGRWYDSMDLQPAGYELALGCTDGGIRLLEFGSGPTDEYIANKTRFVSQTPRFWHLFQAQKFVDTENHFPTLFHLAWNMKSKNPTQTIQKIFLDRYQKLKKAYSDQGKELDSLPSIIQEMVLKYEK
jgi:WD40 repeat protein